MSANENYPVQETLEDAERKKKYEKPQILEIKVLEGRTGPCALTADLSSCQGGVFTS